MLFTVFALRFTLFSIASGTEFSTSANIEDLDSNGWNDDDVIARTGGKEEVFAAGYSKITNALLEGDVRLTAGGFDGTKDTPPTVTKVVGTKKPIPVTLNTKVTKIDYSGKKVGNILANYFCILLNSLMGRL